MLFGETVAVYCENQTEHTDTLCGQNAEFWYVNSVRTSQETHYVSTTKPNRLMLFGETFAVYCKDHTRSHHNEYTRNNRRTVGRGVSHTDHVVLGTQSVVKGMVCVFVCLWKVGN
jgi:hypothetical protein